MADLRPQEAAIMRLWDAGASMAAIACSTGLSADRVRRVVNEYHCAGDQRRHRAAMARASAFLLRAIQLTGARHRSVGR